MMTRQIMEAIIGEKIADDVTVSPRTRREIGELRAAGRKILDGVRAQNEVRFPWLMEQPPFENHDGHVPQVLPQSAPGRRRLVPSKSKAKARTLADLEDSRDGLHSYDK